MKTEPTHLKSSICLICKQQSDALFAARILNKYDTRYFRWEILDSQAPITVWCEANGVVLTCHLNKFAKSAQDELDRRTLFPS